jgi:ribosomal protein S6
MVDLYLYVQSLKKKLAYKINQFVYQRKEVINMSYEEEKIKELEQQIDDNEKYISDLQDQLSDIEKLAQDIIDLCHY